MLDDASTIMVIINRPDSQSVTSSFDTEVSSSFELLVTYYIITGDINIHMERPDDSETVRLVQILYSFGFEQFVKSPTYDVVGVLN